jgi:hypothetical protein
MATGMNEDQKRLWDFRLDVIKTIALIVGGLWVVITFSVDQAHKMAAAQRELLKPYYEKKMALYLEASQVAAHLATNGADNAKWRDRFFELYWGELGFVESQYRPNESTKSVEELMVAACTSLKLGECHFPAASSALDLSRHAHTEMFNDLSIHAQDELFLWKWLVPAVKE